VSPNGEFFNCGKSETYDRTYLPRASYEELRLRGIDGHNKVEIGSVFGYEVTTEERPLTNQIEEYPQTSLPAILVRYRLILSPGWHARSLTFNHVDLSPAQDGSTYTWEVRNLPYIEQEPASPVLSSIAPRLEISYSPIDEHSLPIKSFARWNDVATWLSGLMDAQASPDPNITEEARLLTANARTDLDRLKELGYYVQAVRYEAIEMGLARGGGFRPRPASDTLIKQYGDCKDKATLFRALLAAVGIKSYMVAINASNQRFVHSEWPSPNQFNHVIVAIQIRDGADVGPVIVHPVLGKLFLFDPTNPFVPVGYLPMAEQGGLALIIAPESEGLLKLPTTTPTENIVSRAVTAELQADGTIDAIVNDQAVGESAANDRKLLLSNAMPEFAKIIERWVVSSTKSAVLSKVEPADSYAENRFHLRVDFRATRYGQLMNGKLLIFKPTVVARRQAVFLTETLRTLPVVLAAQAFDESFKIKLPPDFKVDEIPDQVKLEAPFGQYSARCEAVGREIIFTRHLEIQPMQIPPTQYLSVRDFFRHILAIEQAPVVLVKE
jgi:transglutaminase-like putative cysteine protease